MSEWHTLKAYICHVLHMSQVNLYVPTVTTDNANAANEALKIG